MDSSEAPPGLSSMDWIGRHARARPQAPALARPDAQAWTWAQLRQRARAAAAQLARGGVGPGDRVAALAHNAPELLVAQAACARLGALFAPLNVRLADEELAWILADARPRCLLAGPALEARASRLAAAPEVAPLAQLGRAREEPGAPASLTPQTPALMIYTSGTTGRPRGCVLTHGNLLWSALQFVTGLGLGPLDRHYAAAPLFHIAGLGVFTLPMLYVGGASVLPARFDPQAAARHIRDERISCAFMVPVMWRWLSDTPAFAAGALDGLRLGVVGGAPCPPALRQRYQARGVELAVGYGMTEAAPMVTLLRGEQARAAPAGAVGWPGMHVQVCVRGPGGAALGPGERGEVCVRGPNVMAGYWQQGQLVRDRIDAQGWLATGDVGWQDARGMLVLVDRLAHTILTGGENVYPAEVERALERLEGIQEVGALGLPDEEWGQRVCAAVVWSGSPRQLEWLRREARPLLAGYKLPRQLVSLEELPRNPTGKIDRRALRAHALDQLATVKDPDAPDRGDDDDPR